MNVQELIKQKSEYIVGIGGYLELLESDNKNNDLNREIIKAYVNEHNSTCYLGNINFYGKDRKDLMDGKISCYEKYAGREVMNFEFTFIVPVEDKVLEELIKQWNSDGFSVNNAFADRIFKRIDDLGGVTFIWS